MTTAEGVVSRVGGARTRVFWREVRDRRDTVDVLLVGDLDLAGVPRVEWRLLEHRQAGVARIVLDLRGLNFIDLAGIHLIERWAALAEAEDFQFAVVPGSGAVLRTFELAAAVRAQQGLIPQPFTIVTPAGARFSVSRPLRRRGHG